MFIQTTQFGKIRVSFKHERHDIDANAHKIHLDKISIRRHEYPQTRTDCLLQFLEIIPELPKRHNEATAPKLDEISAFALLHPNDNFSKDIGREIALKNVIKAITQYAKATKKTGREIMSAYYNR